MQSSLETVQGMSIFHRYNANDPSDDKARWIIERLYELLHQDIYRTRNSGRTPVLKNVFRRDIYERGQAVWSREFKQEAIEAQQYDVGLAVKT